MPKHEKWESRLGTNALDPLQVIDMQAAIRERKKRAQIQGVWFLFEYNNGIVYYHPENAWVPCGYLNIKQFTEE